MNLFDFFILFIVPFIVVIFWTFIIEFGQYCNGKIEYSKMVDRVLSIIVGLLFYIAFQTVIYKFCVL